jgi:hypothetical protein
VRAGFKAASAPDAQGDWFDLVLQAVDALTEFAIMVDPGQVPDGVPWLQATPMLLEAERRVTVGGIAEVPPVAPPDRPLYELLVACEIDAGSTESRARELAAD